MTRNGTSEDVADEYSMQLQQQQQRHQQELTADSQHLSKNDRTPAKNNPRKKHPVYSNLRKAAKKSCCAASESVKNNATKVQDKRDNIVEQEPKMHESKSWNSMETATLADIPDSWELLYDWNLLPDQGTVQEGAAAQESVASEWSSAEHVQSAECQPTEALSSWNYDGDSKESTDSSEQGVEEYYKNLKKQRTVAISSTPSENISMHFLLRPQQLKESTSGSLRCCLTITDELQSQTLEPSTSIESKNHLEISKETEDSDLDENLATEISVNADVHVDADVDDEADIDQPRENLSNELAAEELLQVAEVSKVVTPHKHTLSEGSTQWEGIDDSASTLNDVETVNWSCEIHSNEDNEQLQQDCDDPYKNWMERPRRGTLRAVRYKTEMCRTYEEGLPCSYGVLCQFAHGFHELRFQPRHPKHKTELCHMFHSMGICRYGRRCSFVHTENLSLLPQMHCNQQQQPHQQQPQCMYINENHYANFSGLAISIDKVHSATQSSCHAPDSVYKNCSDSDSANYYDAHVNDVGGGEKSNNENYSNGCNVGNDATRGVETTSNPFGSSALSNAVQLQPGQHAIEETQLQQMENAVVPSLHQEALSEGFASPPITDNSLRHSDQKMVCFINGASPPVPWTNAVLYVPYEACSFHNAEGQLLQSGQFVTRYYNNNNNCTFYGHQQQQQLAQLQPLQQRMPAPLLPPPTPQPAVAAFQASNGVVYFNNALQIAPNTLAAAPTTTMATAVVNNAPFYAAPFEYPAAAEPQQIFQQAPNLPANYFVAAAQSVVAGNHANKYFQVVPHLGAVPYGSVYYVATTAATNYPTTAYGSYAYTTNA